ncbi:MAG TPA: response regulator [Anaerolineae bacterium]|nr:response regulator [Anaerolineae bacterium]HOQ97376.1 response regulator [Anaerolineae bacterium]HPL27347.1 response regulator [Anaerolineae bacterium]
MAQILVVEDEVALVDVIKTVLTSSGHTILQAYDGQTGLDTALRERPALVVADHMLPLKTGLEMCHDLKEAKLEPPIPFMLMTAGNVPLEDSCPDAVLRKPFAIEELEEMVNSLLLTRAPSFFG